MRTFGFACSLLGTLLLCLSTQDLRAEQPALEFHDGDRVTLLGAGFIERLQQTGYLETVLTSRLPGRDMTFRNLGWSGDTVWGEARGLFGGQPQGFERLMHDVKLTDPTVILIAYGNNEAHGGEAGLPRFRQGMQQLLDKLTTTNARLALLSPLQRENLGPPLPDPTAYNANVKRYAAAIKQMAAERELPYFELNPLAERDHSFRPISPAERLTTDTLTLTNYGTWLVAGRIATALGVPPQSGELQVDVIQQEVTSPAGTKAKLAATDKGWKFDLAAGQLPYPMLPEHAPPAAEQQAEQPQVVIKGLPADANYRLLIDGQEVARGSAAQWNKGLEIESRPEQKQIERLRRLITTKNELFFNRHRPQNETYLFLFRKHEQGNNAVEIPQFDPLIESKEHEIADARVAQKQQYVVERVE
jgi:lysophospholipase L1-like esterase